MKLTTTAATLAALLTSSVALALPQSRAALPQPANIKRDALFPASVNCGPVSHGIKAGLANVSPPSDADIEKSANRLATKGGTCTTPAGSGRCIRVACDNTSGIFMCNTDGHAGPFSADCAQVAKYIYRGEEDGADLTIQDVYTECTNPGLYSNNRVSGQAFAQGGQWNVISGYANCGHPSTDGPAQQ